MKQILWTGFTILLTIAIILFCTYFPGVLWDMTFHSADVQQSVSLELPNMDTLIEPEETEIVPPYFPSATMEKQYPNAEYEVLDTNTSTYESEEGQAFISAFSKLVSAAIYDYFGISCTPEIIFQYTDLWRVFVKDNPRMVDFYCSCTVILQQDHVLWQVTAYGTADGLTHLSRTPYTTTEEEKTLADIFHYDYTMAYSGQEALNEMLKQVSGKPFLPDTFHSYFNGPFAEDMEQMIANQNYSFANMSDHRYKITLRSDVYNRGYAITFNMARVQVGKKLTTLIMLLSIEQMK